MEISTGQWVFPVPFIGGRYRRIPQLAVYTTYIPLIYCQLGDYMVPTTYQGNQETPLNWCVFCFHFLETGTSPAHRLNLQRQLESNLFK